MTTYCGYIALIGRPNVGKSTLLNQLIHQKISITSRKPQTTRHRILGIETEGDYQFVYVDTPGIHESMKKAINQVMNKTAIAVIKDVDVIAFVIEGTRFGEEEEYILEQIKKTNSPTVLVLNKIDKITNKDTLLPFIESISKRHDFKAIIPISAKTGKQVDVLHQVLKEYLPENPFFFDKDQATDKSVRFLCSEIIREKIFRFCGQELPYATTVIIESFVEEERLTRIHALIWVDRDTQKRMIIGEKGLKLKEIATEARLDMERLLETKVFLQCFCKVKSGWSNNADLLKQLGYDH